MANEKIVLAQLDIDAQALIKSAQKSKEAIDDLTEALEDCKEASGELGDDYKEIAENLVKATKVYNILVTALKANTKAMESLTEVQREFVDGQEEITATTGETGNEIEGQAKTFNVYKKQMMDSLNSISAFNGGLGGLITRAQEAGGVGPLVKNAFDGISGGIKGMGQAVAANPLGILLMVIGPIIDQLKNFAPLTNAVEQAMAALSPVIDFVSKPIQALAEGITWVVGGFAKIVASMGSVTSEAVRLKKAEQDLGAQMALQDAANEKAKQQMEGLTKQSEDHTLSEIARANALRKSIAAEKNNYAERKNLAENEFAIQQSKLQHSKDLSLEELRILNEGSKAAVLKLMEDKNISTEELKLLEEAKVKKMEIAGEETQMKQNQADAIKTITDELIEKANDQTKSNDERVKALQDSAAIERAYHNERVADATRAFDDAVSKSFAEKGVRLEDINGILEQGNAYKNKAALLKLVSQQEIDALINANTEKQRLGREETEMLKGQNAALIKLDEDMKKEAADRAQAAADNARKKREEAADKAITHQKQMLNLFVAEGDAKAKSLQEELNFEKDKAEKSKAILKAELDAKKMSRLEYRAAIIAIEEQEQQNTAQINTNFARAHLDLYIQQNKDRLAGAKELTRELIDEENKRRTHIFDENMRILQLESGFNAAEIDALVAKNIVLTTEQAKFYTDVLKLREAHQGENLNADKMLTDATAAKEKADKAKKKEDLQKERQEKATQSALDYEFNIANADTQYQEQVLQEQQRYDVQKANLKARLEDDLITQEQYNTLVKDLDEETASNKKKLAIQNMQTQLSSMQNVASALGDTFGQSKELALAQATMNAGQAILSIWSGTITANPILDTVLKGALTASTAVKTGKQIKEIQSAKKPKQPKFAQGGLVTIGGNRHSAGGTLFTGADGTRFEAEQGELIGVMNRNAAAHFMAFNNAFPAGGGSAPNYFAGGGIVSREIASPSLNIDELAAKIALANSAMPAPVVAVQDIVTQGNSYVQVREAANF